MDGLGQAAAPTVKNRCLNKKPSRGGPCARPSNGTAVLMGLVPARGDDTVVFSTHVYNSPADTPKSEFLWTSLVELARVASGFLR
jgi:hypothetical protein